MHTDACVIAVGMLQEGTGQVQLVEENDDYLPDLHEDDPIRTDIAAG
jgi:hypothetical protein